MGQNCVFIEKKFLNKILTLTSYDSSDKGWDKMTQVIKGGTRKVGFQAQILVKIKYYM